MLKKLKLRAKNLKRDIPAVICALVHPKTPWYAKALAAVVVVYALSPIDLIPDFIPVLGYLDDVILLPALIALTIKCLPQAVIEECRANAQKADVRKKRWYFAIPFAIVWMLIIWLTVRAFF